MKEMLDYYAERAAVYDDTMGYLKPEVVRQHAAIVRWLEQELSGKDVLELGCGPGFWTAQIAPFVHAVLGVDINRETLVEARKKDYPEGRVTFVCADIYELQDLSASFDAGFAFDVFSHICKSRFVEFIAGFHAKLTPGAVVVFIDQTLNERRQKRFVRTDEHGNMITRRELPDGREFEIIKNYFSESEMRTLLEPWGSEIIYFEDASLERWGVRYRRR